MQIILKIGGNDIKVNNYEGFKKKALMTIPTANQELSFSEILSMLEKNDLSKMLFYNQEEDRLEEHGSLIGYSKLISYNNNMESGLAMFTFEKPNEDSEQITELQMALVSLYEQGRGNNNG